MGDWDSVDDKCKRDLDSEFVSGQDHEYEVVKDNIQVEFPDIPLNYIASAWKRCLNTVDTPRPREEFMSCMRERLS